jgi:hypothetical protein
MDDQAYKEVYFHEYCKTCEHEGLKEHEEPCAECMGEATNLNTHRPVRYEKKTTKEKK